MSARVAVLLAAYNGEQFIREQVDSILAQEGVDISVFVSVDNSNDGTEALVDAIASSDSSVFVLPHGQHFGGAGPNFYRLIKDVDFASFDYVALADQDDIWLPSKLSRAVELIAEKQVDAYSSNVTAFWPDGRQQVINKSQPQTQYDFLFEAAGPGCTYVLSNKLAANIKSHLINNPAVNLIVFHDWLIYAFARANGYRWLIDRSSGMLYRQHNLNQVGANAGFKAFTYRADKVLSGWGLSQAYLVARAIGMEDDSFVKVWSSGTRLGYLRLAIAGWSCRRRVRDKVFFILACLLLCLVRPVIKVD